MRRLAFALLTLTASPALAAPPTLPGQPTLHGPSAAANAILHAELMFEAQSERQGSPAAWGAAMDATDGLEFNGTGAPLRGVAAIVASLRAQDKGGTLRWAPREVFASTGNMGTVWGDWQYDMKTGKKITGRYVTVWRQDGVGRWKVLVDIGNPDS